MAGLFQQKARREFSFQSQIPFLSNLLGDFENSQKSESSESRKPKGTRSFTNIDPDNFYQWPNYHDTVKPVERGGKKCGQTQSIDSDSHLKHKHPEKGKFSIVWNIDLVKILVTHKISSDHHSLLMQAIQYVNALICIMKGYLHGIMAVINSNKFNNILICQSLLN